jgi:hypothetical protein
MDKHYILTKTNTLKKNINIDNFIFKNMKIHDENILHYINNQIIGYNEMEENIANYILNSTNKIDIKTIKNIKTFFNLLKPLNSKYDMGMINWEVTYYKKEKIITFHNNISKLYYQFIYDKYIKKIREKLTNSFIPFYYIELKEYRYNKTKEIVFSFKLN